MFRSLKGYLDELDGQAVPELWQDYTTNKPDG